MSADASWGLLCFLERGLRRDFVLRRDTGVLEGLEGGLPPPPGGGRSTWMPPGVGEQKQVSLLVHITRISHNHNTLERILNKNNTFSSLALDVSTKLHIILAE